MSAIKKLNEETVKSVFNFEWVPRVQKSTEFVYQQLVDRNLITEDQAKLWVNQYYKYMIILSENIANQTETQRKVIPLLPSSKIIRLWKMHALYTTEYPRFCQLLGFDMINYNPTDLSFWDKTVEEIEGYRASYEKTLSNLKTRFENDIMDSQVWPSTFEEMVQQHLFSFHINGRTLKEMLPRLIEINNDLDLKSMAIQEVIQVVKSFRQLTTDREQSKFMLVNKEIPQKLNGKNTLQIFEKLQAVQFPLQLRQLLMSELMINENSADSLLNEYQKFMMISCLSEFPIAPSGYVDEAWHMHINFLKNYLNTCREVRGNIMHHMPSANDEVDQREELSQNYTDTMNLYNTLFGETSSVYWPDPGMRIDQGNNHEYFWVNFYQCNNKMIETIKDLKNLREQQQKTSCGSGCNGSCSDFQVQIKKGCSSCNGSCSDKIQTSCGDSCNGSCSDELKKGCSSCNGSCSDELKLKKGCSSCNGSCSDELKKGCSSCNGSCSDELKKGCSSCNGSCSDELKKGCSSCNGSCSDELKKGCSSCNGSCSDELKKSCSSCNGSCSDKLKKGCSSCNGSCSDQQVKDEQKEVSCNGSCNGSCSDQIFQTQLVKISCNGSCNGSCSDQKGQIKAKENCNGSCNGSCSDQKGQIKAKENCNGSCNGSCSDFQLNSLNLTQKNYQKTSQEISVDIKQGCSSCNGSCSDEKMKIYCRPACKSNCSDKQQTQVQSSFEDGDQMKIHCRPPCKSNCSDRQQTQDQTSLIGGEQMEIRCRPPCKSNCSDRQQTDGDEMKIHCRPPCTSNCSDKQKTEGEEMKVHCRPPCTSNCTDKYQTNGDEMKIHCRPPCTSNCSDKQKTCGDEMKVHCRPPCTSNCSNKQQTNGDEMKIRCRPPCTSNCTDKYEKQVQQSFEIRCRPPCKSNCSDKYSTQDQTSFEGGDQMKVYCRPVCKSNCSDKQQTEDQSSFGVSCRPKCKSCNWNCSDQFKKTSCGSGCNGSCADQLKVQLCIECVTLAILKVDFMISCGSCSDKSGNQMSSDVFILKIDQPIDKLQGFQRKTNSILTCAAD